MDGTLRRIAAHVVRAVGPLADAFHDDAHFQQFMLQLGWQVPGLPASYLTVGQQADRAVQALAALADVSADAVSEVVVDALRRLLVPAPSSSPQGPLLAGLRWSRKPKQDKAFPLPRTQVTQHDTLTPQ